MKYCLSCKLTGSQRPNSTVRDKYISCLKRYNDEASLSFTVL